MATGYALEPVLTVMFLPPAQGGGSAVSFGNTRGISRAYWKGGDVRFPGSISICSFSEISNVLPVGVLRSNNWLHAVRSGTPLPVFCQAKDVIAPTQTDRYALACLTLVVGL